MSNAETPEERRAAGRRAEQRAALRTWHSGLRSSSSLLGLGMQLAGTVIMFVGGGVALDLLIGTMPWLTIAGALFGMVALFYLLLRVNEEMSRKDDTPAPMKKTSTPGRDPSKNES